MGYGAEGQSTKVTSPTGHNDPEGGAHGVPKGSQNKPCKPHFGAQGQKKAGGK